jgi:hypothetical protein
MPDHNDSVDSILVQLIEDHNNGELPLKGDIRQAKAALHAYYTKKLEEALGQHVLTANLPDSIETERIIAQNQLRIKAKQRWEAKGE